MAYTSKVTLQQGVGKNSGKPYTAVKISLKGEDKQWNKLVFPTPFEADYVVDHFGFDKPASVITRDNGDVVVIAGDFEKVVEIDSVLERKYVNRVIANVKQEKAVNTEHDDKLNLDDERADEGDFLG